MKTYLLTWVPDRSPQDEKDLRSYAEALARGETKDYRWSAGNNQSIEPGDRVFLLKQGQKRPGLICSGKVQKGSYQDWHWIEAEGDQGKKGWFVMVAWDAVKVDDELPREDLVPGGFPSKLLQVRSSGSRIPDADVGALEALWARHVGGAGFQAAGTKGAMGRISPVAFQDQFKHFKGLVLSKAPGAPFRSFREGLANEEEGYKELVYNEARSKLDWSNWKESEIGKGRILGCVIKAIEINNSTPVLVNNLVQWQNRFGEKRRSHRSLLAAKDDMAKRRQFERWLFDFFHGNLVESEAFEQFRDLAGGIFDLVAYLFFLKDWQRFMPIAPTTFDKAFGLLGLKLKTSHHCSWETYQSYNQALLDIRQLLREAAQIEDARLIDAHSFCWMLVSLGEKVAPASPTTIPLPKLAEGLVAAARPETAPGAARPAAVVTDEDFAETEAEKRRCGRLAEDIALQSEQRRLRELGVKNPEQAVESVANQPALGYDLVSREANDKARYIEVKSARRSGSRLSFFLSDNEWRKSQNLTNYYFYLVLGVDTYQPEVLMIAGADIPNACLTPVNYLATLLGGK